MSTYKFQMIAVTTTIPSDSKKDLPRVSFMNSFLE